MNRWRVGEDRGSKEMDRYPLTNTDIYFETMNSTLSQLVYLAPKKTLLDSPNSSPKQTHSHTTCRIKALFSRNYNLRLYCKN
jgi:hypothetical protein